MRIVITGGGTGGHVYPGLAVAETLAERVPGVEIVFVGGRGIEQRIVASAGLPFRQVASAPWPRRPALRTVSAVAVIGAGTAQAIALLVRSKPHAVLATGGYASAPVGLAAAALSLPLVIQEQNLVPGATNRLLGRWARTVSVPHDAVAAYFPGKAITTGVPVRKASLNGDRPRGLQRFGLDDGRLTVLVLGGSLGAQSLNAAVAEMAGLLTTDHGVQILHQTGKDHEEWVRRQAGGAPAGSLKYVALAYIEDVADAYACADVVICRAGAGTLAEVTANGLPAVAAPYPFAVAGEQDANARVLEAAGAAVIVRHDELSGARLVEVLAALRDPSRRRAMAAASRTLGRPGAAEAVGALVLEAAHG